VKPTMKWTGMSHKNIFFDKKMPKNKSRREPLA
jgi:hypothetical protein